MIKAFIPALIWSLIILALSLGPGVNIPEEIWDLLAPDKWAHMLVYLIQAGLLMRGFHLIGRLNTSTKVLAISISILFGILMEVMQYCFFPNRFFEVLDIIANIIGSLFSLIVLKYFLK